MSQSTKLYAGVVILAALGGAIYYAQGKDKQIGVASTTNADLPDIKGPEDADKLEIKNADKTEITLEKRDGKWMVTKPLVAPANQSNADQVVKNLKELKAKEVISAQPSEDTKKEYDLSPEKGVHVVASKDGEKKLAITFGTSGPRGQMALVEGKPAIYGVSGYSSYLYTREVKGFRETEILKFDDANVNNLTIAKKGADVFSFTKEGDKWSATFKGKPIERFDEEKAKDAVRAFKALTADDFGDGKTTAETGIDEPDSTVTIQLKDNAGKFVVKVGKTSTGTNRWAMKEGSETIYSIPSYSADWATAEVSKFQKSLDGGTDKKAPMPPPGMPGMPHGMPGMGDPHGMGDGHGH